MRVEVLLSTMNQNDFRFIDKMNIQTDTIIINQKDSNSYQEYLTGAQKKIKIYTFNERGIGLSRNNALMRSTADICLMADDDMEYVDEYEDIVLNEFKDNPKADMIVFNVPIHKQNGEVKVKIKKDERVRFYNSLKYGTVNFAFKRESILKNNILFSLLFGASRYGSGEDSIFISDVLKHNLKVYSSNKVIANIRESERNSSWFSGYDEKYFFDRGALFAAIGGKYSSLLILQFIIRHKSLYKDKYSLKQIIQIMSNGNKDFKKKRNNHEY